MLIFVLVLNGISGGSQTKNEEMKIPLTRTLIPRNLFLRFRFRIYILIKLLGQMIFRIHVHTDTSHQITLSLSLS